MEDNKIKIKKLNISDKNEIEQLIQILYLWWGEENGFSREVFEELIKSRCLGKDIPVVIVAIIADEVVGTISLVANDLELRQDLYPVITSFFVKENYRNLGVAKKMMQEMIEHCRNKFGTVYLATDLYAFYEKFGFEYMETCKCSYSLKENKINYHKIYRKEID